MPHEKVGYSIIQNLIAPQSKVLDLGCGDGLLLLALQQQKGVKGFGVEISEEGVSKCVEKGLYCYQGDIDEGLTDYKSNSFDYVILNQTLQSIKRPDYVLHEIMRISKKAIISFPNFGYYKTRCQLLCKGKMPKNELLPYEWYESPNIHHLTIKDFELFCNTQNYNIECRAHFSVLERGEHKQIKHFSNFIAQYGFFLLNGENVTSQITV